MFDALLTKLESDLRTGFDQAVAGLVATTRRQLDDALAEVVKERAKGLAEVAEERSDLHREIAAMHKHKEAQEGHVELNVGGYRFETSVQTLRRLPHTFFDAYFSGRYAQDVCADGSIFIDRDGEHFGQVLQYLRDGVVAVAEQEASDLDLGLLRWLKREFGFYCIELSAEEKAVEESIFVVGGSDGYVGNGMQMNQRLSSMHRYDALSGAWLRVEQMAIARYDAGLCELAGYLYAAGGICADVHAHASVERYDLDLETWSVAPAMPRPRSGHCACVVGVAMYVLGGCEDVDGAACRNVFKFDSQFQVWTKVASMPDDRKFASACVLGKDIYVFGGQKEDEIDTSTTYRFCTVTGIWSILAPMPKGKSCHRIVALDGLIYVIGGNSVNGIVATVHCYDPVENSWRTVAPMSIARSAFGAFMLGGDIYAMGGWAGPGALASVERYSVDTDSWSVMDDMVLAESRHSFDVVVTGGAERADLFDSLMAKVRQARR
jgi:hypothetical protein